MSTADLHESARAGSQRALGRLLTLIERGGDDADEIVEGLLESPGRGHVVGITGTPGSGKSTLVGRLVRLLVERGRRPGVLAVDPSSPMTGGAILGDRVRMEPELDGRGMGAFIRSMASRGQGGGLALAIPSAVRLLASLDFDPIIVETVGVGQLEVDVVAVADTCVVVATPGFGDAVQANKSGLGEVADVFVVNKADLPGATDVRRDLELMLHLGSVSGLRRDEDHEPPIVMCVATEGSGVEDLWAATEDHLAHLDATDGRDDRRAARVAFEVRGRIDQIAGRRLDAVMAGGDARAWLAKAVSGDVSAPAAARAVLALGAAAAER